MKNYVNLLHFEVNRFWKLYVVLIVMVVISQIAGVVLTARREVAQAQEQMKLGQLTAEQYTLKYGNISFDYLLYSPWFQIPVLLCVAVLLIYVFFIWYRDWFAKGTFIYRLLMLPTARIQIYFAKLMTIMLYVLGLVAVQTMLMQLNLKLFEMIIPTEIRGDVPLQIIYNRDFLDWFYPNKGTDFILLYSLGLLFVAVIFTCILLERSYGWKGIILAVIYAIVSGVIFMLPFILDSITNYLYPEELIAIAVAIGIVLFMYAVWLASRLLTNKIKV